MNEHSTPHFVCPTCHYRMDSSTNVSQNHRAPIPGDIGVCLKCGEVLVFGPDLVQRPANLDDLLPLHPREKLLLERAQKLIREQRFLDKKS